MPSRYINCHERRCARTVKATIEDVPAERMTLGKSRMVEIDRRRAAVRGLQPALRAQLDYRHQQSAIRRVDRRVRVRAADRCAARPADRHTVEERLGPKDVILTPAGRVHYFRNDGVADAEFMLLVGSAGRRTSGSKRHDQRRSGQSDRVGWGCRAFS
jgi:hypothetical protein